MSTDRKDIWLKIFCPRDACLKQEERIRLPDVDDAQKPGRWLQAFCPEKRCRINSPTGLP